MNYVIFASGSWGYLGAAQAAFKLLKKSLSAHPVSIHLLLERSTLSQSHLIQWLEVNDSKVLEEARDLAPYLCAPRTGVVGALQAPFANLDLRQLAQTEERQSNLGPWMSWARATDYDESWFRKRSQKMDLGGLSLEQVLDGHVYPPLMRATLATVFAPEYPFYGHEVNADWLTGAKQIARKQNWVFEDIDSQLTLPWLEKLKKLGVQVSWVDQVLRADFDGTKLTGVVVEKGSRREVVSGDEYLSLMPRERLLKILPGTLRSNRFSLEKLAALPMRIVHGWKVMGKLPEWSQGFELLHLGLVPNTTPWRMSFSLNHVDLWDCSRTPDGLERVESQDIAALQSGLLLQLRESVEITYQGYTEVRDPMYLDRVDTETPAKNFKIAGEWLVAAPNRFEALLDSVERAIEYQPYRRMSMHALVQSLLSYKVTTREV